MTVAVNYFGVTQFLEGLAPAMAKANAPRAVVVSSMAPVQQNSPKLVDAMLDGDESTALAIGAQLEAAGPREGYLNYPSSKRALSRWVRRECITPRWAGAGIPLNAVAPGTVITNMTRSMLATEEGRAMVDSNVPMPLNYHSEASVIAKLLLWLTSEENTHVTGRRYTAMAGQKPPCAVRISGAERYWRYGEGHPLLRHLDWHVNGTPDIVMELSQSRMTP